MIFAVAPLPIPLPFGNPETHIRVEVRAQLTVFPRDAVSRNNVRHLQSLQKEAPQRGRKASRRLAETGEVVPLHRMQALYAISLLLTQPLRRKRVAIV
jgi:hypothetical protein